MTRVRAVLCVIMLIEGARGQTSPKRPAGTGGAQAAKATAPVSEDWPVWGGENRDFIVNASGLADS